VLKFPHTGDTRENLKGGRGEPLFVAPDGVNGGRWAATRPVFSEVSVGELVAEWVRDRGPNVTHYCAFPLARRAPPPSPSAARPLPGSNPQQVRQRDLRLALDVDFRMCMLSAHILKSAPWCLYIVNPQGHRPFRC
jgi:hypothetical protein